ncbi:MAG TPA: hypothetical protein DEQ38_14130 [Elusimicrobia bacterium]|nr:hypothetical protein [Elusimicrobiota bacterium]
MGGCYHLSADRLRDFFGISGARAVILFDKSGDTMAMPRGKFNLKRCAGLLAGAALAVYAGPAPLRAMTGGGYQLGASVFDAGGGAALTGGEFMSRGSISESHMPPDNLGNSRGGNYSNRVGFYNPPRMTFQKGLSGSIESTNSEVQLSVPADFVDMDMFDIVMSKDPINEPIVAEPYRIVDATRRIEASEGPWSQLWSNNLKELHVVDDEVRWEGGFHNGGMLSMSYRDDDNDGNMDGTNPPVRVDTLQNWVLDPSDDTWVRMPNVGGGGKRISSQFTMPGVYAIMGSISEAVRNVIAYPVPFRPNGPEAGPGAGQTGTEGGGITFKDLPQRGNIEIYTIDGRLVRKLPIPAGLVIPKLAWDVKNDSGQKVASGVYIWRVSSGSNSKTGKLMVIW